MNQLEPGDLLYVLDSNLRWFLYLEEPATLNLLTIAPYVNKGDILMYLNTAKSNLEDIFGAKRERSLFLIGNKIYWLYSELIRDFIEKEKYFLVIRDNLNGNFYNAE